MPEMSLPVADVTKSVSCDSDNFATDKIRYGIDSVFDENDCLAIRGWAYSETMSMPFTDIFLQLYNSKDSCCYSFSTMYQIRPDIIPQRNKKQCGFFVIIPKSKISSGDYYLGIKIRKRILIPIVSSTKVTKTNELIHF
jgi:hypothetical protein